MPNAIRGCIGAADISYVFLIYPSGSSFAIARYFLEFVDVAVVLMFLQALIRQRIFFFEFRGSR